MILSVHVPKTAGNSFRESLAVSFGSRMLTDYGDWAGCDLPQTNVHRAARTRTMRERGVELLERYDLIHGHFVADKYAGLFPNARYVAFFRDPYQQAIAHYHFLLRNPQREHPEERIFHAQRMTLLEYLEWDAFRNQQSQFLGTMDVEDFEMVGLSSAYQRSMEIFGTIFGIDLGPQRFSNVNVERKGLYPIARDVGKAVETYRARDLELYRRAVEMFAKQSAAIAA